MSAPALEARGLGVTLGDADVLRDVDLAIAPGELVVLVGPNGAGKSTLLAALAGDLAPTTGQVLLDGAPIGDQRPRALARRRAMLLQKQSLAFGFVVRDVVAMGRAPWLRTEAAERDEEIVAQSLARADVTHLADRLFPTLSGGEQARTSFARLLAQQTPVVLLDEPTAALDIRHQEALLGSARDLARAGCAVVVVLHDLSLSAAYADRIVVLSGGRVRADGPPAAVLTDTLLSEVYEHPVDVVRHDGTLVVVPRRSPIHPREAAPCSAES